MPSFARRRVVVAYLIRNLGVVGEGLVPVGTQLGDIERPAVLLVQLHGDVAEESLRTGPHVDHDVMDCTRVHRTSLASGEGSTW